MKRIVSVQSSLLLLLGMVCSFIQGRALSAQDLSYSPSIKWLWDVHDIRLQRDDVPQKTRDFRNRRLKQRLETNSQLGDGKHLEAIPYRNPMYTDEYLDAGSTTWAVVTFDHYTVIPMAKQSPVDSDDYMVYTELRFVVQSVVIAPVKGSSSLRDNDTFDVDIEGGVLSLANGIIRKTYISDQRFKYEPGHSYFVQVVPSKDGSNIYAISTCWEIRKGTLYPNSDEDFIRTKAGVSHFYGRSAKDAASYIYNSSRFYKKGESEN